MISSKYGRTASREPLPTSVVNHRKAIRAEVEDSRKRLKTGRIDLYFAHFDDGITPIEEIKRGFEELIQAWKIIHIGLSNFPAWRIAAATYLAVKCMVGRKLRRFKCNTIYSNARLSANIYH